jgi:branched-chain amino acid transport system permease protein
MEIFLQQLVNGVSIGSTDVLVAVGITLIFGLTRLVNFAHGQFVVLGSFLTYAAVSAGLPFGVSMLLATLAVGLAGVITDRALLRRTIDAPLNGFIISLGLVIALEGAMTEIWSTKPHQVASPFTGVMELGSVQVATGRIVALAVAAVSVAALFVLLQRSDAGRSMRAVAENRDAAALVGVNVGASISMAFFLGAALAGLGGAFLGTLFPFTPYSGTEYVLKGLAVALIGGLGSIHGALIVGLALGVVETMGSAYGIGPEWRDGYAYIAMIGLLVWRPGGLFGGKREY